jgi:aldehyde dehydrogenase (NAD+)
MAKRTSELRVGAPLDETTDLGPLISDAQRRTSLDYVELGTQEGARLVTGGNVPEEPGEGFYLRPAILADVDNSWRVAQEEIFGPVLAIITFDDVEEALAIANRSQYGLVSGIWTRDINKAMSISSRIKTGQVYINTYGAGGGVELPFGGVKSSGHGREKGFEALYGFSTLKTIAIKHD